MLCCWQHGSHFKVHGDCSSCDNLVVSVLTQVAGDARQRCHLSRVHFMLWPHVVRVQGAQPDSSRAGPKPEPAQVRMQLSQKRLAASCSGDSCSPSPFSQIHKLSLCLTQPNKTCTNCAHAERCHPQQKTSMQMPWT